jgi:hypothetical protein
LEFRQGAECVKARVFARFAKQVAAAGLVFEPLALKSSAVRKFCKRFGVLPRTA